jgi:hypothetical protein
MSTTSSFWNCVISPHIQLARKKLCRRRCGTSRLMTKLGPLVPTLHNRVNPPLPFSSHGWMSHPRILTPALFSIRSCVTGSKPRYDMRAGCRDLNTHSSEAILVFCITVSCLGLFIYVSGGGSRCSLRDIIGGIETERWVVAVSALSRIRTVPCRLQGVS